MTPFVAIALREIRSFMRRPLLWFVMVVAPVLCIWLFLSMMRQGLPTKLPAGLVDEDNTAITRQIERILGSMEATDLSHRYASFHEARQAMDRGEIYAFFYVPKGVTDDALANRQPQISFYTNDAFLVAGSLEMKDMRYASELASLAIAREVLYAHGMTDEQAMATVQPITIEAHPIGNPHLNYSVYLNNIILPCIMALLAMLCAAYTLGMEWKRGSQRQLFRLAGDNAWVAVGAKLLPQTIWFSLLFVACDVLLYKVMHFPCHCGIAAMMLLGVCTVLAAQGLAVFFVALFAGQMRMAMSACSLWGIVSFSITGFSYPVQAMDWPLQLASWLFPIRQYFLIYVCRALNGYSLAYAWPSVVALAIFILLPLTVMWRLRRAFLYFEYQP